MKRILVSGLLALASWQLMAGGYIYAKAIAAQWLIADAWQKTRAGQRAVKPWDWADTWPVSRLTVPRLAQDLYILQGSSGRTLAFGPGHMANTPLPGQSGNSVIGGHRDTHFHFLKDLVVGDTLAVEKPDGEVVEYRVFSRSVVDHSDTEQVLDQSADALTLVTCYPFDALVPGGPLRFVVVAKPVVVDKTAL